MGQPNWKRLAELGQLPDYMKNEVTVDILETHQNSLKNKNNEPNREPEVEHKNIQEIVEETQIQEVPKDEVRKELEKKSKKELQEILTVAGLDANGSKEELIEKILSPSIEVEKEEKNGEFIDSLIQ